jgi:hypothetical protein
MHGPQSMRFPPATSWSGVARYIRMAIPGRKATRGRISGRSAETLYVGDICCPLLGIAA